MMNVSLELQEVLSLVAEESSTCEEGERLSDEFLSALQELTRSEVGQVARILVDRFPDVDEDSIEADLPRVGEELRESVVVRKVEHRRDSRDVPYWVVGMEIDGKSQTKKVSAIGDRYQVAWKLGKRWRNEVVDPGELREWLAKSISRDGKTGE